VNVAKLVTDMPVTIRPDDTIDEAICQMNLFQMRHLPVVDSGIIIGMVSDRDILLHTGRSCRHEVNRIVVDPSVTVPQYVNQIMSSPVHLISYDTDLARVVELMLQYRISALPVGDDSGLLGIVTRTDLIRWCRDFCETNPSDVVANSMQPQVLTVDSNDSATKVAKKMYEARIHHLPVTEDGRLVGIISQRDVFQALGIDPTDLKPDSCQKDIRALILMTPKPTTAAPDDPLAEAISIMLQNRFGALPVVSGESLIGILTETDILRKIQSLLAAPVT